MARLRKCPQEWVNILNPEIGQTVAKPNRALAKPDNSNIISYQQEKGVRVLCGPSLSLETQLKTERGRKNRGDGDRNRSSQIWIARLKSRHFLIVVEGS